MKKNLKSFLFFTASIGFFCLSGCASSCEKAVNYSDYITERRENIYLYADDDISVKIYCSKKESPFAADGYLGDMCPLTEVYVTFPKSFDEVNLSVGNYTAEMSYSAVDRNFYSSFTAEDFGTSEIEASLEYGGNSHTYTLQSVKYPGVMSCDEALSCVIDYDGELFAGKTANGIFDGEIFVRLIYDDDCYYYVGVCGKDKKISAFLLDGVHGKIIAAKELQG